MTNNFKHSFSHDLLELKCIGSDMAEVVQEIYFNAPTYFRRVDGTEPLPGMALKDINDFPPKRGDQYIKIAALISENSKPIGYADLHVNYRCKGMSYLGLLILREDAQGKGLGRRVYNLVEKFLIEQFDVEKIYLGVSDHNQVQAYWIKMGFVPNGFTYKWQGEKIESMVTEMEKKLSHPSLHLERPSQALYKSFLEFVDDMRSNNQSLWDPYLPKIHESSEQFVTRLHSREEKPESNLVPETIYWAIYDGNVVGRISLRHRLEGNLHKIGGHIGYEVGPKWRRRGFATKMLHQILLTDKAHEIGRLLLTCSPNNEASNKTILANGGKFTQKVFVEFIHEDRNHYWIDLEKR
ncbi:MAG: GNAT family N-acetyltransferase [Bdellovibrio sp.]